MTSENSLNNLKTYQKDRKVFKVIVLGDCNVGKTCLTYRFCEGNILDKPSATIGVDFRDRLLNIEGEEVKLQLWDTAGQEKYRKSIIKHFYRNVHAVVIVYDLTKMSSFLNVAVWLEECEQYGLTSEIPRILVGNKCDCADLVVSTNLAQRLADTHSMPLFETSAQSDSEGDNVEAIFMTLAHKLVKDRPMMKVQQSNVLLHSNFETPKVETPSNDMCRC